MARLWSWKSPGWDETTGGYEQSRRGAISLLPGRLLSYHGRCSSIANSWRPHSYCFDNMDDYNHLIEYTNESLKSKNSQKVFRLPNRITLISIRWTLQDSVKCPENRYGPLPRVIPILLY